MADVKKQEKDYTKEVEQLIPEAESIARVSVGGLLGLGLPPDRRPASLLGHPSCSQESFRKAWINFLH